MDWYTMPVAVTILGVIVIVVFRRDWKRLIARFKKIGKLIEVAPDVQQATVEAPKPDPLAVSPTDPAKLKTDDLLLMHDTPFIVERDRKIRADLERLESPGDREKILVRLLAGAYTVRDFERVYGSIFGSQIGALAAMNSAGEAGATPETLRVFYDAAAAEAPDPYKNYTFEQWMGFLTRVGLARDVADGFAITPWGTEFLVHLARSKRQVFKVL